MLIVSQENQTLGSPHFLGKEKMLGPWEEEAKGWWTKLLPHILPRVSPAR